jgi:hypothetical protein
MKLTWRSDEIDRALPRLRQRVHVAIVRSLKRAAVSAQTVAARVIAEDMDLKQADVRKAMEIKQGRVESEHTIALEVTGARIPLVKWVRNPQPGVRRRGGVTAKLPSGAGRYPNAFVAQMQSGHVGVFARAGKSRLPIRELFGPSIVGVFAKHTPEIAEAGQASLEKNLRHELEFATSGSGAA